MQLIGQERQRFSGPLQVGIYGGNAVYDYKVIGKDTLLDGDFRMQQSDLKSLLESEDASFLFSGSFVDGFPTGPWNFQFGAFQSERRSQVIDYQYRVLVSGVQESGSGTVVKGKPNGSWTYAVNRIVDSEISEILFRSKFDFENGIPQRNFNIESEDRSLVGRFLRNGIAHDEWALYDDAALEATERWFFKEGVLQKILFSNNGQTKEFSINTGRNQLKTVNLDARYLKVVQLQATGDDAEAIAQSGVLHMLDKNAVYYQKIDSILSELGTSDFNPEFKVKLPYFPLDSLEKKRLSEIYLSYEKARTISAFFLNSSQLNILKLSDEESNYLFELVRAISSGFLDPIEEVVNYQKTSVLEYVPRSNLQNNLWPQGIPSKTIQAIITKDSIEQKRPFTLSNATDFDFGGPLFSSLKEIARYAAACLAEVEKQLNVKLVREKRQQALVALEEKLVLQEKGFGNLLDSLTSDTPADYRNTLQRLKQVADEKLGAYGVLKNPEQKLEQGQELTRCFENLLALGKAYSELPVRVEELRVHYEDGVWNPFMATVMKEAIKKRITNAYRKVLIPYFLEQVRDDFDCSQVNMLLEEIQYTHERMFQLREEDTAKLERKLRREQDPKVVLELFHKPSKSKEN